MGDDALLALDFMDLDGDGLTVNEKVPYDLDSSFGAVFSPREAIVFGAPGSPGLIPSDVGGNVAGSICDLGCYERGTFDQ